MANYITSYITSILEIIAEKKAMLDSSIEEEKRCKENHDEFGFAAQYDRSKKICDEISSLQHTLDMLVSA